MHYLSEVARDVDKSHPRLGNLAAVTMLTIKASKLLIIVSPRGCGKSRVTSFVGMQYPDHSIQDRLSVANLGKLQSTFTGFRSVVIVDDIAKTQTPYARITTVTTLAELIYSHYCVSHMSGMDYEITDFYGSALINVQPVLLRECIKSAEWEASMQDKSLRYYHLYRPVTPNPMPPSLVLDWGYELDKVEKPTMKGKLANKLFAIGEVQWGLARLQEHISDLLRACAALDRRHTVNTSDYRVLIKALTPMVIESLVMTKTEFEADRRFNSNELAILTEYMTYGNFTLTQISRDYKLSESQCRRIIDEYAQDWVVVLKSPTTYSASPALRRRLKEVGLI